MEKKSYIVTDLADVHTKVAGVRRAPGSPVSLTWPEAEWELKRGVIAAPPAGKPPKKS